MTGASAQHEPPRARRRRTIRIAVIGVATTAGGAWVGWLIAGMPGMDHGVAADPALGHVHGLAIDAADDTVVVATHTGLVAVPAHGGGHHERIGSSFQDVMGIATIGPGHLIGSGHPDVAGLRDGLPGHLGLIESADGGATWSLVSLTGEADLHAIVVTDAGYYAWDAVSGQVMATNDLVEWEVRSTIEAPALAADPADPHHIVAPGPAGLIESNDGGRTWPRLGHDLLQCRPLRDRC